MTVFNGLIINIRNIPIKKIVKIGAIKLRRIDLPALRIIINSPLLDKVIKKCKEVKSIIMGINE
tara:strand:+ start:537 stop:728 length:192 start_codon:yes stop_codon:yes gene_type:complete